MAKQKMRTIRLNKSNELLEGDIVVCDGFSPGHVASVLGITRQRVHQLISKGKLSATRVVDSNGDLIAILISADSIRKLIRERLNSSNP